VTTTGAGSTTAAAAAASGLTVAAASTESDKSAIAQHERHYAYEVGGLLAFGAVMQLISHLNSGRPWQALAIELGAIAVVALSYFFIGIPGWRDGNQPRMLLSIAINIVAVGLSMSHGTINGFLSIIVLVDIWTSLARKRDRLICTLLLAAVMLLGLAHIANWDLALFSESVPQNLFFFGISLGGALWMSRSFQISRTNAQLVDDLRRAQNQISAMQYAAGEAAERERLAGEIHDTLAQGFTSVVMQAQAATAALNRGNAVGALDRLQVMESVARENLAEARALVAEHATPPVPLQDASLVQALHRLGDRWSRETGITVTVTTDDTDFSNHAQEVVLLRAAQEALTNVRRHAKASAAAMSLTGENSNVITLEVTDNGQGISDDIALGYGLSGMKQRVEAVGGTLKIDRANWNGGTAVKIMLPRAS